LYQHNYQHINTIINTPTYQHINTSLSPLEFYTIGRILKEIKVDSLVGAVGVGRLLKRAKKIENLGETI
jgi:hypothetical protein